ncbi:hypothetical protein [Neisseria bacilliformis]|nr:hypothetical protein [Neisseria bacilliformis]
MWHSHTPYLANRICVAGAVLRRLSGKAQLKEKGRLKTFQTAFCPCIQ